MIHKNFQQILFQNLNLHKKYLFLCLFLPLALAFSPLQSHDFGRLEAGERIEEERTESRNLENDVLSELELSTHESNADNSEKVQFAWLNLTLELFVLKSSTFLYKVESSNPLSPGFFSEKSARAPPQA